MLSSCLPALMCVLMSLTATRPSPPLYRRPLVESRGAPVFGLTTAGTPIYTHMPGIMRRSVLQLVLLVAAMQVRAEMLPLVAGA